MGCIHCFYEAAKWLPVLMTSAIFGWSWYAYHFQLIVYLQSLIQQVLYLVIFNSFYILALWSYIKTVIARNRDRIPEKFYLSPEVTKEMNDNRPPNVLYNQYMDQVLINIVKQRELPIFTRTYTGGIRYCEICKLVKPDRCHHCSICNICVLKMDHHCPWINNCVSFANYKFFVLFLGYLFALCLFAATTTFPFFLKFYLNNLNETTIAKDATSQDMFINSNYASSQQNIVPFGMRFQILILFFVSGMLTFGLMFMFFYHVHLLFKNRTTLEAFRPPLMTYGPDRNGFNLGGKENFYQLFGHSAFLWFLPVSTSKGTGLFYVMRQFSANDEEARQELFGNLANNNKITYSHNSQTINIT